MLWYDGIGLGPAVILNQWYLHHWWHLFHWWYLYHWRDLIMCPAVFMGPSCLYHLLVRPAKQCDSTRQKLGSADRAPVNAFQRLPKVTGDVIIASYYQCWWIMQSGTNIEKHWPKEIASRFSFLFSWVIVYQLLPLSLATVGGFCTGKKGMVWCSLLWGKVGCKLN